MWLKAALFLIIGFTSAILIFVEAASLKVAVLLCLTIWAFCRAYYFAFYVIQHYIDPSYRFSGLLDFVRYLLRNRPSH
jgi:hypothetical protein